MRVIAVDGHPPALFGRKRAIRKAVSRRTEGRGFLCPEDALKYARGHPVHAEFLDLETPQMHGLILAKNLQKLNPKVNVIFVAATSNHTMDAWKLHASDYILKPVRWERIQQSMQNLRYPAEDIATQTPMVGLKRGSTDQNRRNKHEEVSKTAIVTVFGDNADLFRRPGVGGGGRQSVAGSLRRHYRVYGA